MTDRELVQALQAGNREVFGELVDRYRDAVQGLCYRIAGNRLDAEELAHEGFVEAWLRIGTLREPEKLGGWLRMIALNLCRMWYRRRKQTWQELPDEVPAVEQDVEDPALLARMSAGLSELPPLQRLVLVLHYFEGLSYEQMAEFLDVPIGTVMSRLHRARCALRQVLEGPVTDEDVPMTDDVRFKQEVQAEIAVLLEMFSRESSAAERLTVILQHSPERFVQLIEQADAEQTLANLAILLPRLGAGAMDAALSAAFSPDARTAGHSGDILRRSLSACRPVEDPGWEPSTPGRSAYVLMDRLTRHPADAAAKAELLLDLLDACEDDSLAALVTNVLLCYPKAAFGLLIEWFRQVSGPDDLYARGSRLFALCRMGTCFCRELAELLRSPDVCRQAIALAGAEAVGRCFLDPRWVQDVTAARFAYDVRCRVKWAPLRSEDMDPAVLAEMVERAAYLLDHPQGEIRNAALGALGRLRAAAHVKRIIPHAVHEDASTRLAAIRALGEIGETSATSVLMHVARGPDRPGVRRAAIETLGRMEVQEAQDLLIGLLQDAEPQVQEAAVASLAELDSPAAQAALQDLLTSGAKHLKKAAARAVFSRQHARRPARPPLRQSQSQRLRGNAQPVCYCSICAAIQLALPEIQPYEEQDLTRRIAAVCIDYSLTRRRLVDEGWMTRERGTYELTEPGQAAWRVEQFILAHYLK